MGGRDVLSRPAPSGHWLSCTGCLYWLGFWYDYGLGFCFFSIHLQRYFGLGHSFLTTYWMKNYGPSLYQIYILNLELPEVFHVLQLALFMAFGALDKQWCNDGGHLFCNLFSYVLSSELCSFWWLWEYTYISLILCALLNLRYDSCTMVWNNGMLFIFYYVILNIVFTINIYLNHLSLYYVDIGQKGFFISLPQSPLSQIFYQIDHSTGFIWLMEVEWFACSCYSNDRNPWIDCGFSLLT